jgi:hypothetical protein
LQTPAGDGILPIEVYMEITYRIFTWLISGTAWLLLMLVFGSFVVLTLDFCIENELLN